jgi:hypothetical protein
VQESAKTAMDLYIYYQIRAADAESFRTKVLAMQHNLARDWNIVTALKRRPEEKDGMQTWMEVYLAVDENFAAQLNQAVAVNELSPWIAGKRHTEQFLDVSLCV